MPRPHLPSHLSLQRFKSSNSIKESPSSPGSQVPSRSVSPNRGKDKEQGGDYKAMGLVLKVQVLKGRNLAPKDKSGTSDPVGRSAVSCMVGMHTD